MSMILLTGACYRKKIVAPLGLDGLDVVISCIYKKSQCSTSHTSKAGVNCGWAIVCYMARGVSSLLCFQGHLTVIEPALFIIPYDALL